MFSAIIKAVPAWLWMGIALMGAPCMSYLAGDMHGAQRAGQAHIAYVKAQEKSAQKVAAAQIQVVEKTEIKYRDRIQKIYVKGEQIEQSAPLYVTLADTGSYRVNAGFVRLYDAGWLNEAPGPAVDADREPAAIQITAIAEIQAANAASCLAWREQALGLREFYEQLRTVSNGQG